MIFFLSSVVVSMAFTTSISLQKNNKQQIFIVQPLKTMGLTNKSSRINASYYINNKTSFLTNVENLGINISYHYSSNISTFLFTKAVVTS